MNKYLVGVIGALWLIVFSAGSWWVSRVEKSMSITSQLQFKDLYLNGQIRAAPVATPTPVPSTPTQ